MSTTSFAWLSLLFLPLCLHSVCSEKLEFLKLPQRREIVTVGANLTINCTTNNETAQTAVYYRRRIKSVKWKKIEAIPGKVVHEGSVYTLVAINRNKKGQYQCRASGNTNSTETLKWPDNVGIIIVRGGLDKGSRKPDSKVQENKKPRHKKPRHKKPGHKRPRQKKTGSKKPRQKKPGKKKSDKKRNHRNKPGRKRGGTKKPGHKRGGTKKPGRRKPIGTRRPGKKSPGSKKQSRQGPNLKVLNDTVTVIEGSLAVLKCIAQVQAGDQPIISWYRSKTELIGCSNTKDSRCSSGRPASRRYLITYKVRTARGGNRKKLTSYLRIPKTTRAQDQKTYKCKATNKQGSSHRTIRVKIQKKRSS